MGMEQSKMKKAEKTQTSGMKHSDTIAKSEGKRRSALQIMGSLIGLVKPLLHIMWQQSFLERQDTYVPSSLRFWQVRLSCTDFRTE